MKIKIIIILGIFAIVLHAADNKLNLISYKSVCHNGDGWYYKLPKAINNNSSSFSCSVVIHPISEHLNHGLGVAVILSDKLIDKQENMLWGRLNFYKGISRHAGFRDLTGKTKKYVSWTRLSPKTSVKITLAYNKNADEVKISFNSAEKKELLFSCKLKGKKFSWKYLSICSMRSKGNEKISARCQASGMEIDGKKIQASDFFSGGERNLSVDDQQSRRQLLTYLDKIVRPRLPVKGTPLFNSFNWKNFPHNSFSYAKFKIVKIKNQPFKTALHMEGLKKPKSFHTVQIPSKRNLKPIKKGDLIFMQFTARCLKSSDETGEGVVSATCVVDSKSWSSFGGISGFFDIEWKTFYGYGVAKSDYPSGKVRMHLFLSKRLQTIELGGIVILNLGQNINKEKLPRNIVTYEGRDKNAAWRKKAAEMIEKNRKGAFKIKIYDRNGIPLKNAEIKIEMQRHAYGFGCYVDDHPILYKNSNGDKFRYWFKKLFNKATIPLFWGPGSPKGGYGWENPKYKKNYLSMLRWCKANNLATHGHVLVWPTFLYTPPDVIKLKNKPEQLRKRINKHIRDVVTETKDMLDELEVINELYGSREFTNILGKNELVKWFKLTKSLTGNTILYINDNNILTNGGKLSREFYLKTVDYLTANEAPLGGLGFQTHLGSNLASPEKIWNILDEFKKRGKPVQATEFTVNVHDRQLQAEYTRDFYTAFFAHPSTVGIINWGFWAGQHYSPNCAFFTKDWKLKANGKVYMDLVFNKWWTRKKGKSDNNGCYKFKGFWGDYKITVKSGTLSKTFNNKFAKNNIRIIKLQMD